MTLLLSEGESGGVPSFRIGVLAVRLFLLVVVIVLFVHMAVDDLCKRLTFVYGNLMEVLLITLVAVHQLRTLY